MKTAILGVWHVHAPAYTKSAIENGEVVGVWDADKDRCESFGKEFGIPVFGTVDELLSSDAEAVICCAATNMHKELIVKAALAGKHIFTEKVLALTVEDCLEVKNAVEKSGVRFVISYPQKKAAGPKTVISLAKEGKLGRINTVRFRNCHSGSIAHWLPAHFYDPVATGGGAMMDLGAHGMYLIAEILGKPETYRSAFTHFCRDKQDEILNPSALEDNAVTVMTYKDGAIAVNETGFVSGCCPMMLEIDGTSGFAHFENGHCRLCSAETENRVIEIPVCEGDEAPIDAFLKGKEVSGCGIEDAIVLTEMMVGAYKNR